MTSPALKEIVERMRARTAEVDRKNQTRPSTYLDYIPTSDIEYWADQIERAASLTAEQRRQVSAIADGLEKCCQSKGEHIGPEQYGCFCDMAKILRALLEGLTQEGP